MKLRDRLGSLRRVARETDPARFTRLREAFSDTASNVPEFTRTARTGGHRSDEGLENLLPSLTPYGQVQALKEAIVGFLDEGNTRSIEVSEGDRDMKLDAAFYYHFRVEIEGVRVFVKVLYEDAPDEPDVRVISVKRDDR